MSNFTNSTKFAKLTLSINNSSFMMSLRLAIIVISFVNVSVLANKKLKDSFFKYLLIMSLVDIAYVALISIMYFTVCTGNPGGMCGTDWDYVNLLIYIVFSEFLTSALALFNILLEIFLTVQRIFQISFNKSRLHKLSVFKTCLILFSISLVYYSPTLAMNRIDTVYRENGTRRAYVLSKTPFSKTNLGVALVTGMTVCRIALVTVVLTIVNIVAMIKFNAFLHRKSKLEQKISNIYELCIV
jgi:hypothetical protein